MHEAVVVGGGVVGASVAYHLAAAGADALLIDRHDEGRATDAGAGIVSPGTAPDPSTFALEAADYYPEVIEAVEASAGVDTGYDRPGRLVVAAESAELEPYERARNAAFDRLDAVEDLEPASARERFPPLGDVEAAFYYDDAGRVDGRRLTRALVAAGEATGLDVMDAGVDAVERDAVAATGVVADGDTYEAGAVVIAGGAWSAAFAEDLDTPIPVAPQRGQIAHLGTDRRTKGWPIVSAFRDHYLVPWPDGRVAAGATRETDTGFAPDPTAGGVREVLAEALRVAPGLSEATVGEIRVGLRPRSRDGRPVIGETALEDAYVATGHGALGLTLGPYTGKVTADLVLGRDSGSAANLERFAPARFR